jgi:hypothetical protein
MSFFWHQFELTFSFKVLYLCFMCRYNGYVDKSKTAIITVFFSNSGLFQLQNSADLYLDGTFKVIFLIYFTFSLITIGLLILSVSSRYESCPYCIY